MTNIEILSNFDTVSTLELSTTMAIFFFGGGRGEGGAFDHFLWYWAGGGDLQKHSLKISINNPFLALAITSVLSYFLKTI